MNEPVLQKFLAGIQSIYGPIDMDTVPAAPDPQLGDTSISHPGNHNLSWKPPLLTEGEGRYLWTDAFGVINFLTLYKSTSDRRYLTLASCLITTVHDSLGRTRDGSQRLPGATDTSPLTGGLRIGKKDEFGPDGDGQYHHYLTLWMFALNRMAVAAGEEWYNSQAIKLAKAIHDKFMYNRGHIGDRPRMYWKMAMDLSKPLVKSEGNLDPIDGYLTLRLLKQTGERMRWSSMNATELQLDEELRDYKKIVEQKWGGFESSDALDIGMTLWSAHWACQESGEDWSRGLCERMLHCLDYYNRQKVLPHSRRLAFREFGLALGLRTYATQEPSHMEADMLSNLADEIVSGWEQHDSLPEARNTPISLKPITLVMYCAALYPGAFTKGYLEKN